MANVLGEFLDDDLYQDLAKYWTSKVAARVFRDEEVFPEKSVFEQKPIFTGFLRTLNQRACRSRDLDLAYSLLQTKRMWPELGLARARLAAEEHRALVSRLPEELDEETIKFLDLAVSSFVSFNRGTPAWTRLAPSISGHTGAPASKGGALGHLQRQARSPAAEQNLSKVPRSLKELIIKAELEKMRLFEVARDVLPVGYTAGRTNVVLIPEPAKFRVVTTGDPALYTLVRPVQGELLRIWSLHPCSTNIDASIPRHMEYWSRSLAEGTAEDSHGRPHDWTHVVSGDYKGATDTLNVLCSLYVMLRLVVLLGIPEELAELCYRTLWGAELVYPAKLGIPETLQTTAQLMGSPLSFVLLCIINLSTWLRATRGRRLLNDGTEGLRGPKRPGWMDYDAKINGDDIAFPCNRAEYDLWKEAAGTVGFKLSLGKSYFSRSMALINSQLYRLRPFGRVGYLNLKLCTGSSLKAGHADAWDYQIGKAVGEMVRLSPWTKPFVPMAMSASKRFLPGANWFLPATLGGCGVPYECATLESKITRWQRKLAAAAINDPSLSLGLSVARPGFRRALRLLGKQRVMSSTDIVAMICGERRLLTPLERKKRELAYEMWFARLTAADALVTQIEDLDREEVAGRVAAWRKAVDTWEKAAIPLKPIGLWDLLTYHAPPLITPDLPGVPSAWQLVGNGVKPSARRSEIVVPHDHEEAELCLPWTRDDDFDLALESETLILAALLSARIPVLDDIEEDDSVAGL